MKPDWHALPGATQRQSAYPPRLLQLGQTLAGAPGLPRFLVKPTRPWPLVQPNPLWSGRVERGEALLRGFLLYGGEHRSLPDVGWYPAGASPGWLGHLHSFSWLYDFRATSSPQSAETARRLVRAWLTSHTRARPLAFGAETCARRLMSLVSHLDWLSIQGQEAFLLACLRSLSWQAHWLARFAPYLAQGGERLTAGVALLLCASVLPASQVLQRQGWRLVTEAVVNQFLDDGTHRSRNPAWHLSLLADVVSLRAVTRQAGWDTPDWLDPLVESLAATAKLWLLPDGSIAPFMEQRPSLLRANAGLILERAGAGLLEPALSLPQGGYQRLDRRRTSLLVETGTPPGPGFDSRYHAGTLSFLLTIGEQPIVTNCGTYAEGQVWEQVGRQTAAHSTLVWDSQDSSLFDASGHVQSGPQTLSIQTGEAGDFSVLELAHDGYAPRGGGTHYRRLKLNRTGELLEGEDRLVGASGPLPLLRFHLAHGVQAEMAMNRRSVLLRLPARERGWRFEVRDARLSVGETAIANPDGRPRKAQQLLVTADPETYQGRLDWAFVQEGAQAKAWTP